jgi:hypothetical protein
MPIKWIKETWKSLIAWRKFALYLKAILVREGQNAREDVLVEVLALQRTALANDD